MLWFLSSFHYIPLGCYWLGSLLLFSDVVIFYIIFAIHFKSFPVCYFVENMTHYLSFSNCDKCGCFQTCRLWGSSSWSCLRGRRRGLGSWLSWSSRGSQIAESPGPRSGSLLIQNHHQPSLSIHWDNKGLPLWLEKIRYVLYSICAELCILQCYICFHLQYCTAWFSIVVIIIKFMG